MEPLNSIPTNIITGFLGVGKTTAIMHLLKSKPENERWAVLVNEFGEVGIDGGLFSGNTGKDTGVFIREVPGGCMCCAAGLPMQIALNMLLAKAKPQRLLIEPTGLGHPREVLSTLNSEHYKSVLDIQHTITLVDSRNLTDERYLTNPVFQQQLDIADVIVANKSDLYAEDDFSNLENYLSKKYPDNSKALHLISNGELELDWLQGSALITTEHSHQHGHSKAPNEPLPLPGDPNFPKEGYLSVNNQGEGFFSKGWIFKPDLIFDRNKLHSLLNAEKIERLKAIFITYDGIFSYNKADDVLTEIALDETPDSRIELITQDQTRLESFEHDILSCKSQHSILPNKTKDSTRV